MKIKLLNFGIFQVGWLVCVLGGDIYALGFTAAALALHFGLISRNRNEWKLIAGVVVVGCLWDILMVKSGVIRFGEAVPGLGLPLWLVCLWALFATTFMHSLSWLGSRPLLAVAAAALGGPASYWIGSDLANASLQLPLPVSLSIMAAGWALLFPCGIYCAGRLKSQAG